MINGCKRVGAEKGKTESWKKPKGINHIPTIVYIFFNNKMWLPFVPPNISFIGPHSASHFYLLN